MQLFILLLFFATHSISRKQGTSKAKGRKSIGDVSLPLDSHRAPVIKTEPVDNDEALRSPSNSSMKAKELQSTRFSSPIVISSKESDPPTPRAKPAKSNNSKPKTSYVWSLSVPLFV